MPRILIVDDDEIDRQAAERCLRVLSNPEFEFADGGHGALDAIARQRPDVVVTDLRMPGMDGLALVERLHDDYPKLPVVLTTSKGSEEIAVRALKAGASSYVPKRRLKRYLPDTVRRLLEVARATRKRGQALGYLTRRDTHFELPNNLTLVVPLVAFLQGGLKRIGFGDESLRTQIGIALMEALNNAIIHGNLELDSELRRTDPDEFVKMTHVRRKQPPYCDRRVFCRARETARRVEYTIRDEGPGFDVRTLAQRQASTLLDITGRGVMLMQSFMDSVRFNGRGNEVRMVKAARGS